MKLHKALSVSFNDNSEIDIHNDMSATIVGNGIAYELWKIASQNTNIRTLHLSIFYKIATTLNKKHNFITNIDTHD